MKTLTIALIFTTISLGAQSAEYFASKSTINYDSFKKTISIKGPNLKRLVGQPTVTLKTDYRVDKEGITYGYVDIRLLSIGSPAGYETAFDDKGNELRLSGTVTTKQSWHIRHWTYTYVYELEIVLADIDPEQDLNIRVYGTKDFKTIKIPKNYIKGLLLKGEK